MKKINISDSKYSKFAKITKNTSKERNQLNNNNGFKDIRSLVYRSLELETKSEFDYSSSSSETLSDSAITDSWIPEKRTETIDFPLVNSIYEDNLNSSFSISMPYIFTQSNSNCSLKSVDHNLIDVKELENIQSDDSGVFTSTNANSLNLSETANTDNDENSKNSLFCVIDEVKETCSFNFLSGEKELNSESDTSLKSLKNKRKKHLCPHCLKSFLYPSRLKRHINTHKTKQSDSDADERPKSLGSISIVEKSNDVDSETPICHKNMIRRQKVLQCPNCSKSFKCASKLLRHVKTHTGVMSYTCHLCSKAFLEKFNLIAHIKIHKNENPYICEICERAFNMKSNLNRHVRSHIREEQFTCSKCGKPCRSEKKLAIHFRTHEKIPHKCSECVKEFKKKANLNRHVKIHSNEREHSCNLCDYRARQISHLEKHIQRKHANFIPAI